MLKQQEDDGEQNADGIATRDSLVLKYYPAVDPYKQEGLIWVQGALNIEWQLAVAVAKRTEYSKTFIDETLARVSRLFEMLEGQRLPDMIDGLLRRYGYGEVVDQFYAVARTDVSGDPMPLSAMGTNP